MSWELYSLIEDDLWPSTQSAVTGPRPVIAHTHGRWTTVGSREREILSRLAQRVSVFVIEAPVYTDDVALGRLDVSMPMPNVWRAVPRLPSELAHDEDESLDRVRHFAQQTVGASAPLAEKFAAPVQWFFSPLAAAKMLGAFGEAIVVYDCIDERTWLRLAPRGAAERERLLLSRADVVFASDAAALRVRARAHRNVHVASVSLALHSGPDGAVLSRDARWTLLVHEMEREIDRLLHERPLRTPREPLRVSTPPVHAPRSSNPPLTEPPPPAAS